MGAPELESLLDLLLSTTQPGARDLRDALFEYWVVLSRTQLPLPLAADDEPALRRWLWRRLDVLWLGMTSAWDDPLAADLGRLRHRLDQLPESSERPELAGVRRKLDELALRVAVAERLGLLRPAVSASRYRLVNGGGETSTPRGVLRLVAPR